MIRSNASTAAVPVTNVLAASTPTGPAAPKRVERRQSLLASAQDADHLTLDFIEHAGDSRGWK